MYQTSPCSEFCLFPAVFVYSSQLRYTYTYFQSVIFVFRQQRSIQYNWQYDTRRYKMCSYLCMTHFSTYSIKTINIRSMAELCNVHSRKHGEVVLSVGTRRTLLYTLSRTYEVIQFNEHNWRVLRPTCKVPTYVYVLYVLLKASACYIRMTYVYCVKAAKFLDYLCFKMWMVGLLVKCQKHHWRRFVQTVGHLTIYTLSVYKYID